jgi:hypothetical protein
MENSFFQSQVRESTLLLSTEGQIQLELGLDGSFMAGTAVVTLPRPFFYVDHA